MVLTGEGRAFSAGYDIAGIPEESFEQDAEALVAHPFTAALEAVATHPWPVVGALNGHALGGGLELALTADLRICAAGAKLGMPPAKLGLIYGHTGLRRFIDTIGVPRTKELFLTGRNLDAERAERDRPRELGGRRRRARGGGPRARRGGRRERAALDAREQARDRHAQRERGAHAPSRSAS